MNFHQRQIKLEFSEVRFAEFVCQHPAVIKCVPAIESPPHAVPFSRTFRLPKIPGSRDKQDRIHKNACCLLLCARVARLASQDILDYLPPERR